MDFINYEHAFTELNKLRDAAATRSDLNWFQINICWECLDHWYSEDKWENFKGQAEHLRCLLTGKPYTQGGLWNPWKDENWDGGANV